MRNILLIAVLFVVNLSFAYGSEDDSITKERIEYAKKLLISGAQEKAYKLYFEYADKGNAQAMNTVGILLQRGWGVTKDEAASIIWFEKSAEAGYSRANMNLAQIYAKGLGVEQDFAKAVNYTSKLLDIEPKWANSKLGYYYYKGLGVEQDYSKAIEHFKIAADRGSADAYYFLGLCYRNGYGVDRSEGEAQFYLQKANEMGHLYSKQELGEDTPETGITIKRLKSKQLVKDGQLQNVLKKITKQKIIGSIAGEYVGTLSTYDFSGKQIIRETPLKIRFSEPDISGNIHGSWIEADSIHANFEAIFTDSTLQFINTSYTRTDYYNPKQAIKWNFSKAILEMSRLEGNNYLVGNLQMFSPKTKEPEKPMYISLEQKKSDSVCNSLSIKTIDNSDDVNFSFCLSQSCDTNIRIYNLTGKLVLFEELGVLDAKFHHYTTTLNIPKGYYIAYLQKGTEINTTMIFKK